MQYPQLRYCSQHQPSQSCLGFLHPARERFPTSGVILLVPASYLIARKALPSSNISKPYLAMIFHCDKNTIYNSNTKSQENTCRKEILCQKTLRRPTDIDQIIGQQDLVGRKNHPSHVEANRLSSMILRGHPALAKPLSPRLSPAQIRSLGPLTPP